MSEVNPEQHNLDMQAIRSDMLAISVKIDTNHNHYMEKFNSIEAQTTKHNGRMTKIEKALWTIGGGGGILVLLPTLQAIVSKLAK